MNRAIQRTRTVGLTSLVEVTISFLLLFNWVSDGPSEKEESQIESKPLLSALKKWTVGPWGPVIRSPTLCPSRMNSWVMWIRCPVINYSGAQLSGARFATFGGRTVGPRTTGPRGPTVRGPICHFWGADSWAPDNWAPSPFGICNDIFDESWILFVIQDGISMFGMVYIVFLVSHLWLKWSILCSGWLIWYCGQWIWYFGRHFTFGGGYLVL